MVSASSNGVFVTDDNGATYQRVGLTAADVHAVAVGKDMSDQATLVAGTTFSTFETALPVQRTPGPRIATGDTTAPTDCSAAGSRR